MVTIRHTYLSIVVTSQDRVLARDDVGRHTDLSEDETLAAGQQQDGQQCPQLGHDDEMSGHWVDTDCVATTLMYHCIISGPDKGLSLTSLQRLWLVWRSVVA